MDNNKSIDKQFNKEHLSAVLEALIKVKGGEIDDVWFGICWNTTYHLMGTVYDPSSVLDHYTPLWDKYTGNSGYPVPAVSVGYTPQQEYLTSKDKWTGEYGKLRYELLDFLIEELTKAVEEYDNDDYPQDIKIKIVSHGEERIDRVVLRDTTIGGVYNAVFIKEGTRCPDNIVAPEDSYSFRDDVGDWVSIWCSDSTYELVKE